jgi:hypothetical protein
MDLDIYVEEEHWSFVTTLTYMRVALGTRGHVAHN